MPAHSISLSLTGKVADAGPVKRQRGASVTPAALRAGALMHWAEAREAGHADARAFLGGSALTFPAKELQGWGIDPESVGVHVKEEDDMPTKKKAAKGKKKAAKPRAKKAAPKKSGGAHLTAKQFSLDLLAKNPDVTAKDWLKALQKAIPTTKQTPAGFYGYRRTAIETGVIKKA